MSLNEKEQQILDNESNRSSIFVARHKETKLYTLNILKWIWGEQGWMKAKNPTIEEVKEQIAFVATYRPIWTDDINEADIWSAYTIKEFGKYVDNVDFVAVNLRTAPVEKGKE